MRRSAFEWVAKLQRAFPGDERAVWTQTSLAALVDAAAQSPEAADAAYFTLEGMHGAVRPEPVGTACDLAAPGSIEKGTESLGS